MLTSMNLSYKCLPVILAAGLSSCVSLSPSDRAQLRDIKAMNLPEQEKKNPALAGILNLLPGFGNFYLAIGTDQGGQASIGVVNLLLWPISSVWAVPEAAIDANTINTQYTVYYYTVDPNGKKILDQALINSSNLGHSDRIKGKL